MTIGNFVYVYSRLSRHLRLLFLVSKPRPVVFPSVVIRYGQHTDTATTRLHNVPI